MVIRPSQRWWRRWDLESENIPEGDFRSPSGSLLAQAESHVASWIPFPSYVEKVKDLLHREVKLSKRAWVQKLNTVHWAIPSKVIRVSDRKCTVFHLGLMLYSDNIWSPTPLILDTPICKTDLSLGSPPTLGVSETFVIARVGKSTEQTLLVHTTALEHTICWGYSSQVFQSFTIEPHSIRLDWREDTCHDLAGHDLWADYVCAPSPAQDRLNRRHANQERQ